MRYAVIADVHGNLLALETVLKDAATQRVDQYLFAGDYCISHPQPNECLSRIRSLPGSMVIRGNDDQHLERLIGQDPAGWTDGQMQATYWCYRNIEPENLAWLFSLPHQVDFTCAGVPVHMAHSCIHFFKGCEYDYWSSIYLEKRYQEQSVTPALLRQDVKNTLDADPDFQARFDALPDGVYLFGHTHVQWSYASPDGNKWLINCGACGLPLDGITGSIPYAIMEIAPDGCISVEERRIPLDTDLSIAALNSSALGQSAPVWRQLIEEELRTGREKVSFFIRFAETYARSIGDHQRPFSVSTWEAAHRLWQAQQRGKLYTSEAE